MFCRSAVTSSRQGRSLQLPFDCWGPTAPAVATAALLEPSDDSKERSEVSEWLRANSRPV